MEMNASQKGIYNKSFYNIMANINFSIFDTLTGQQISEININSNETSIKKINSSGINHLLKKTAKQSIEEGVRQAAIKIKHYYVC